MVRFVLLILGLPLTATLVQTSQPEEGARHLPPDELLSLIGKDHQSKAVGDLRRLYKEEPTAKYFPNADEKGFYHSWKEHGLSLSFDKGNKLQSVFLYAEGSEGFKAYKGRVPGGLSFADVAGDVEKKLGPPAEMLGGGAGGVNCWWEYPKKGIHVVFKTSDRNNRKAALAWVVLFQPEVKKKSD